MGEWRKDIALLTIRNVVSATEQLTEDTKTILRGGSNTEQFISKNLKGGQNPGQITVHE